MALQKELTLNSGEMGNYWRVSRLTFTRATMSLDITLSLYKDATLAAAGASPLPYSRQFLIPITQLEISSGNVVAVAYAKIMTEIAREVPSLDGQTMVPKYPELSGAVEV